MYRSVGNVPRKRHVRVPGENGQLLFEELMGERGFAGPSALLYHLRSPSAIVAAETVVRDEPTLSRAAPLLPMHVRTGELPSTVPGQANLVQGRRLLLGNEDVRISYAVAGEPSELYRNACGDELVYVQAGAAVLESVFGALHVAAGDYVVVPASVAHRWVPDGTVEALIVEARGHVGVPSRYLSPVGQFLEHAPYCERDLRAPTEPLLCEGERVAMLVRHPGGLTRHVLARHPFDVVAWDGALYPYALSIHDFEPIVGRVHQPPPVHQTFEGPGFVVCSFVPRPYDFHPEAVKVPYHHANVDSDEVLFYSAGNFMSRAGSGIGVGSLSVHPAGFVHGPQPGSVERAATATRTEEVAVMVDTFRPLSRTALADAAADPDYPWTWAAAP